MPTASPNMVARVVTADDSPKTPPRAMIAHVLTPTPSTAVSSGSPAATTDPNVTSSTSAASTTPTTSLTPPTRGLPARTGPPTSTVSPRTRATASRSRFFVSSVRSLGVAVYVTVAYAVDPSRLTVCAWKGPTAVATWAPRDTTATSASTAARWSVTVSPAGATNTTLAMAGRAVVSSDSSPTVLHARPAAPRTANHATTTYQRRRKARRPSR